MTQPKERLRTGLTQLAEDTGSIDLYDRALLRSRQIGRRRAVWAVAGVAAAVIVAGAAVAQIVPRNSAAPALPGTSSLGPSAVLTESSPTASLSPTPAPFAGVDLQNATVTLPPFPEQTGVGPCPTDDIRLKDGTHTLRNDSVRVGLEKSVSTDLDADGVQETVALFVCHGPSEGRVAQVVAFRGRAAESMTFMGQVVGPVHGIGDDLTGIRDVEAAKGAVRVEVSRVALVSQGSAPAELATLTQWRTFAWNGNRFTQTAGSTTFAADTSAAKLTGTATRLVFAPPDGACRTGELTLTVRNDGPGAAENVIAAVILPEYDPNPCWDRPTGQFYGSALADFGTIASGATKTVTVRIVTPDDFSPYQAGAVVDQPYNYFELRTDDRTYVDRTRVIVEYR